MRGGKMLKFHERPDCVEVWGTLDDGTFTHYGNIVDGNYDPRGR